MSGTAFFVQNTNGIDSGMHKFFPPVSRGLEAIHFLSGGVARAQRNYAWGKPDASVVGAPIETPNYLTLKGLTNFIQTEVPDTVLQTTFRVVRTLDSLVDADHCPGFEGSYSSGSNFGTMLYGNVSGNISQNSARFTDATLTTLTPGGTTLVSGADIDRANFALIVTIVGAKFTTVRNETKGTVKVGATNEFGRRPSTLPFRIGSAYEGNTLYKGTCDVALWAHHSVELTPSEVALNVARYRAFLLKRHGIMV